MTINMKIMMTTIINITITMTIIMRIIMTMIINITIMMTIIMTMNVTKTVTTTVKLLTSECQALRAPQRDHGDLH